MYTEQIYDDEYNLGYQRNPINDVYTDLHPRKVSLDYDDYENNILYEDPLTHVQYYKPVNVQNFEQWNKNKQYSNYISSPHDFFDMYRNNLNSNNQVRKISTGSSHVVETLIEA